MKVMRRFVFVLLAIGALTFAACGGDDDSSSSSGGSSGASNSSSDGDGGGGGNLKNPGQHTIGVIPSTATSEFLAVSIDQLKQVGEVFGWKIQVCDGAGDVTKMEGCMQTLVTQKVSAIVTMAIGGPEIQKGAQAAKAAGIPLLATVTTVTPGFEKLYDAVFADDIVNMGKATGEWLEANRKDIPVVGEEITQNYGGQGYINGLREQLKAQQMKFTDLRDTDLANIVNSMKQNAQAIIQKNKGQLTFIDFSDFGPATYWADIERAGRGKDVTVITRYDDPTTVKMMQGGANILVQVSKSWEHTFDMVDALLANVLDNAPFPPASKTVYEPDATVMGIDDFPAGSLEAFPFKPALEAQVAEWKTQYALQT